MNKEYGLLVMFVVLVACTIYSIYRFFIIAPSIQMDHETIKLNKTLYHWSDVEEVKLICKKRYIFLDVKPGVSLKFKGHEEIYFLDMYENTPAIKQFINKNVIEKSPALNDAFIPASIEMGEVKLGKDLQESTVNDGNQISPVIENLIPPEIENELFKEYKNFQFFDIRAAMILLFMIMLVFICIKNGGGTNGWFVVVIVVLALFRLLIWLTYYFKLSDHFLVIRNHNVFWYKRIYFLSDIRSIVFETPGKEIYRMRVVTNDFESEIF
jgi:hypothetical protein